MFSINLSGAIYWLNNVLLLFWTTIGGKICSKTNQPLQIINFAKETFASVFKSKKEQEKQKQRERREQLTKSAPVNLNWQLMSKKILNRKNMLLITRYVLMLVIISSLQNSLEV